MQRHTRHTWAPACVSSGHSLSGSSHCRCPCCSFPQPAGKADNGLTSGIIALELSLLLQCNQQRRKTKGQSEMKMLRSKISPLPLCLFHTLDLPILATSFIHISARRKRIWAVNSGNKAPLIPFFAGFRCHISAKEPLGKAVVS